LKKSTDQLIEKLTDDLQAGRHWHPVQRSLFWGSLFFVGAATGMFLYQEFRPGFIDQLVEFPRFAIEVLSAFLFCNILIYLIFIAMVPGRRVSLWVLPLLGLALLSWLVSQVTAFTHPSPPASLIGARLHCKEEVLIYGIVGMVFFFYFVAKTQFSLKPWQYFLMGLVSGLIPGTLMQMACMYGPYHGLDYHYAPALAVALVAALFMPAFKRCQ
jgi:hypothetical protein